MKKSIFSDLCDIADAFDCYVRTLPSGIQRYQLEDLVQRLAAVIDRTIAIQELEIATDAD
jgi:hypothetical protein